MATCILDVKQVFIPSKKKVTKKGKPVLIPVIIRKMGITGDFIGTKCFRVVRIVRKGELRYSVSCLPEAKKEKWQTLQLSPAQEVSWKKVESMQEERFNGWLKCLLGAQSSFYKHELDTAMPERN